MKKIIITGILIIQAALLLAIFDDYIPSARARAMGGAFTAVADDVSSIFFNPAGLAEINHEAQLGFSQLNGQKFSDFKTAALGIKLPKKYGSLALGARVFGVSFEDADLMSEQTFSLSHGFVLQKDIHSTIAIGYTANYYRLSFDEDETDDALGFDLGISALLHGRTRLGFAVTNLNQAVMGDTHQNTLPGKLALGISYQPYDQVTTSIELKKDFAQETEFMGGVEARLLEPLTIRFGVHQNPATYNGGIGLQMRGVNIDLSYSAHAVLPATFYANLGYKF